MLASVLKKEIDSDDQTTGEVLSNLAKPLDNELKTGGFEANAGLYDEGKLEQLLAQNVSAEVEVAAAIRSSTKLQAFFLVIGTLQWGFGDLIVNKLIFCGEWIC